MNKLYFGDCLDVLKKLNQEHPNGFIDLIYIDPPFNSKRNYNILFEDVDLTDTKAQKEAFADTWSNISYKDMLEEIKALNLNLFNFLDNLDSISDSKSAVSYLTTMAIRIYYMHKALKDTGSFYLHCDSTMSHYLKIVCDLIFGKDNFRNEIVWKRTYAHNDPKRFGRNADRILFYSKSEDYFFKPVFVGYDEKYVNDFFKGEDEKGRYQSVILTGPSHGDGGSNVEWKGYKPSQSKRHWSVPKRIVNSLVGEKKANKMSITQRLDLLYENGYILISKNGIPRFKQYLHEMEGAPAQEIWDDVSPLSSQAKERLGYPTQKPEALLERIITASSNKGDLVADFFCGCGTTVAVAQELKRKWIGVDISHLSIGLIERKRLLEPYGEKIKGTYEIEGLPKDIASAKRLAAGTLRGRLKFEEWIIETMLGGVHNPQKGVNGSWDGHLTFPLKNKKEIVLIEVKSGGTGIKDMRSFIEAVNRQEAAIGVFIAFKDEITKPMTINAKEEGFYRKDLFGTNYDKIQIITVEDLLNGENIKIPATMQTTFKSAEKKEEEIEHPEMFDE